MIFGSVFPWALNHITVEIFQTSHHRHQTDRRPLNLVGFIPTVYDELSETSRNSYVKCLSIVFSPKNGEIVFVYFDCISQNKHTRGSNNRNPKVEFKKHHSDFCCWRVDVQTSLVS